MCESKWWLGMTNLLYIHLRVTSHCAILALYEQRQEWTILVHKQT
jgi:hypothetical protein